MTNRIRLNLDHVQDRLWAVQDSKLDEIDAVVRALLEGKTPPMRDEYIVANQMEAEVPRKPYDLIESGETHNISRVAVIPIYGTIMKRAGLFSEWSGGASSQKIMGAIRVALDDPKVDVIALDIDSPGGTVDGTKTLADFIFDSRGKKPIVAYSDGTVTSAAYWIASAANTIMLSETAIAGSIGVRLTHYDLAGKDRTAGVVRTTIFAGRYKAMGDDTGPLSAEGRDYLQGHVDKMYQAFVADVARNRGIDVEAALKMADGKVFIGTDAVKVGLVDGIGLLDAAVGRVSKTFRGRKITMNTKTIEEMQAELASANERIAGMESTQAKIVEEAAKTKSDLADKTAREAELLKEVRRKGFESTVSRLVSEGKCLPRMVDAGLVDFMMALDQVGEAGIGGQKVLAAEWFEKHCLSETVIKLGEHATSNVNAPASGTAAEEKLGMEIAAIINSEIKLD